MISQLANQDNQRFFSQVNMSQLEEAQNSENEVEKIVEALSLLDSI